MNDEFLKYLRRQVKGYQTEYSLSDGKAFGLWYAIESLGLEEDEAYEAASFDGGNDKDIDFFHIDYEAERVLVGQLKFNRKGQYKGKRGELLSLIHATDWLKDPESLEKDGRKDIAAAARDYLEAVGNGFSVEYLYVYCGPAHKDVEDTARKFNVNEAGNVPSRSCRVMHLPNLIAEHAERIDQSTRIPLASLRYASKRSFMETGAFGDAFVTSLRGDQLRGLYVDHGDLLFNRNVRLFLGARKGGVNAGIRDTISSETDRGNFWAYNNGVTFVCDNFETQNNKLILHNFSIVNGCQTTVTVGNSPANAAKGVRVLARFISAPERAIDSIIRFTNSQNPIRLWDLSAQDKLQKRLKRELAALTQPFFYILRKGETRQISPTDRKKFKRAGTGALCAIRHDLSAQYLAAFRGLPAIAYKDKGRIFSAHYDEVFPEQIRSEEIVLVWQAGSVATDFVKKELEQAAQNDEQERVAILKRGAKFFVVAAMAIILHERNGQTFLNKLKAEVAVSKTTENRLRNYAAIALEWYMEAMQDLVDAGTEVTTLVRNQDHWKKLHQRLQSKWKVYSLSKDVMKNALPVL
ncbi:MAG: AIPR family protein [Acidobacteria bacterium]|nr:AIPR family protein [Acidobacteriota bacterium]